MTEHRISHTKEPVFRSNEDVKMTIDLLCSTCIF